jgi:imidazolonepropionase-like amidohydrolase
MDGINHVVYLLRYLTKPGAGPDGKPSREADPVPDFDGKEAKAMIADLLAHHVVVDPTLTVYEAMMNTVPYDQLEPGIAHVPAQLHAALDSPAAPAQWAHARAFRFELMERAVQTLWAAGVPIVAGTDQTVPGYSLHRELELYVQGGLSPAQALQTATINAARALGMDREAGTIDAGKRADVLLLNADPLANISNTRTVWRTIAAGAVYDPAPLWQSVGFRP